MNKNDFPEAIYHICLKLWHAGYESYLVGGCVRDVIMKRSPNDYDIATNATPEQVISTFGNCIETGLKHGTVTVPFGGYYVEVTTYRKDSDYSDGRHPDAVQFVSTIEEDLSRRDFTINAMAYDPINDDFRDPFHGMDDINNRKIRCVGDARQRFIEDGLRCLRAVRFQAQLGFMVETETKNAILPTINSFEKVANERISAELVKLFSSESPSYIALAITNMMSSGIMDSIIPEFAESLFCQQNAYHEFDVSNHVLSVVAHCKEKSPVHVSLSAFFHDIGKPRTKSVHPKRGDACFLGHEDVSADMTYEIMTRLKFSNELRDKVCHLIRHHLVMYESKWSNVTIRRWVRRIGIDNVDDLLDLYRADILGKGDAKIKQSVDSCEELRERVKSLGASIPIVTSTNNLAISGNDVMDRLGIKPGKLVGDVLKQCLEWVTENPECNNQVDLLGYVDAMKGKENE